jgi:hypothetical protein
MVEGVGGIPPRLPIELCELVIDNLKHDKTTLLALSLACKAFLPASRCHIFHHVVLTVRTAKRFLDAIRDARSPTNPSVYVQHVSVDLECRQKCVSWVIAADGRVSKPDYMWVNMMMPLLALRLHEVTILELDAVGWDLLDGAAQATILSGFQKVKRLKISVCKFKTADDLNQFISSFSSLTDLCCVRTHWPSEGGAPRIPLPHKLSTITMATSEWGPLEELLTLESHPPLHTVNLRYLRPRHAQGVGRLLVSLASSLEHLDLGYIGFDADAEGLHPEPH